jgi:hypothetical protein
MQFSVDTSKDSKEDIKRLIKFLQEFIDMSMDGGIKEESSISKDAPTMDLIQIFGNDNNPSQPQTIQILDEEEKETVMNNPTQKMMKEKNKQDVSSEDDQKESDEDIEDLPKIEIIPY